MEQQNPERMSFTEIARLILERHGQPMYFRDLIEEVIRIKPSSNTSDYYQSIASIYTRLNVDGRFVCYGNGHWGLRDWSVKRRRELKKAKEAVVKKKKKKSKAQVKRKEIDGQQFMHHFHKLVQEASTPEE